MGRGAGATMMEIAMIARPVEAEQLYATSPIRRQDRRGHWIEVPRDAGGTGYRFFWKKPHHPEIELAVSVGSPPDAARKTFWILSVHKPSVQVCTSEGGNRIWLIHLGRVIATFDYVTGVATLGDKGHPNWAVKCETSATSRSGRRCGRDAPPILPESTHKFLRRAII